MGSAISILHADIFLWTGRVEALLRCIVGCTISILHPDRYCYGLEDWRSSYVLERCTKWALHTDKFQELSEPESFNFSVECSAGNNIHTE